MKHLCLAGTCIVLAAAAAHGKPLPDYHAYHHAAPATSSGVPTTHAVPGTIASTDQKRGVPTFIWAHPRTAVKTPHRTPEAAARWYLSQFAAAYGLRKASLDAVYVSRVHDVGRGGVIVFLRQRVDGVEVIHNELKVLMSRDLDLVALGGSLHHAATSQAARAATTRGFRISGERALARAIGDLYAMDVPARSVRATGVKKAGYDYFDLAATSALAREGTVLAQPARVKRVLYPLPDRLEPGYLVELMPSAAASVDSRAYAYVIGADEGAVLMRKNLTHEDAFEYRVWADPTARNTPLDGPQADYTPHPTGVPDGSEPPFVAPTLISMEGFNTNPDGGADPWLPSGATETLGNNVDAYADLAEPDGYDPDQDIRAGVTASNAFDYPYDPLLEPYATDDQIKAAVTQLFYVNNWLHDYYYDSGFDEAAGNAQQDNYGRGGAGGDPLHVQAQDFSGRNNANMTVPGDGLSPRMQMFLWSGKTEAAVEALDTSLSSSTAHFGPKNFDVTAELVLVDDGTDTTNDGCEPLVNTVTGAIAVLYRGGCTFALKAQNAEEAGALGVLVINHNPGEDPPNMLNSDPPRTISIPALGVALEDGEMLESAMAGGPVSANLWRTSDPDRDGTIDNGIVAHEWGHYLHRRLIDCLSSQCSAQSEGWGDFIALHMMIREGDDYHGAYAIGGYATTVSEDSAYYGIRRVPYSVDPAYNALSLRHVADNEALPTTHPVNAGSSANSEVHNAGEIWATLLLEGYVALLDRTLEAGAPYGFDEAQRRMADYVVAGMQLAPMDATFTEQLDAILAAASASDESDYLLLADAFARRGAGSCAQSPPRYSRDFIGVAEDYEVRGSMDIVSVTLDDSVASCDLDGYVDAGETGQVTIAVENSGQVALQGTTITLSSTHSDVSFPGGPSAELDVIEPFATATVSIDIAVADGLRSMDRVGLTVAVTNADACESTVSHATVRTINADLGPSTLESADRPMESWTVTGTSADTWTQAEGPDGFVWHGANAPRITDAAIESPQLEVGTSDDFIIRFEHRYQLEADPENRWDGGVIELSTDGGSTWNDISMYVDPGYDGDLVASTNPLAERAAYSGVSAGWPAMIPVTLNLGRQLAGRSVKLRFRVGTDGALGFHGWDIDNIEVQGTANQPFVGLLDHAGLCDAAGGAAGGCCQAGAEPPAGPAGLALLVLLALARIRRRRAV